MSIFRQVRLPFFDKPDEKGGVEPPKDDENKKGGNDDIWQAINELKEAIKGGKQPEGVQTIPKTEPPKQPEQQQQQQRQAEPIKEAAKASKSFLNWLMGD